MILVVTSEQIFPLAAVPPLDRLWEDAYPLLDGHETFNSDLWFSDGRRFDVEVRGITVRSQPDDAPPVIELEGVIESQYVDGDDNDLWKPLPQPTGFKATFSAASTRIDGISDMVNTAGDSNITVFPLPEAA